MNKNKNSYTIPWTWERRENVKTVRVHVKGLRSDAPGESYEYKSTQRVGEDVVTYGCEIVVEIDVDRICRTLAGAAAHSKVGRSTCLSGAIKAKRIGTRELKRDKKTFPLASNATLCEEEVNS